MHTLQGCRPREEPVSAGRSEAVRTTGACSDGAAQVTQPFPASPRLCGRCLPVQRSRSLTHAPGSPRLPPSQARRPLRWEPRSSAFLSQEGGRSSSLAGASWILPHSVGGERLELIRPCWHPTGRQSRLRIIWNQVNSNKRLWERHGSNPPGREEDPPSRRGVPRQLPVTQESRLLRWTQLLAQERSRRITHSCFYSSRFPADCLLCAENLSVWVTASILTGTVDQTSAHLSTTAPLSVRFYWTQRPTKMSLFITAGASAVPVPVSEVGWWVRPWCVLVHLLRAGRA